MRYVDMPEASEVLERFTAIYDEPFSDTSGIPTSILSKVAREHVKVALSADGGDEQFCGYETYPAYARHFAAVSRVPLFLRRAAAMGLGRLVPYRLMLSAAVGRRAGESRTPQVIGRFEKWLEILKAERSSDIVRIMNEKAFTTAAVSDILRADTALDRLAPARVGAVGVLDPRAVSREVDTFYRYQGCRAERVLVLLLFQMWAE